MLTDPQRQEIFKQWKAEFHARDDQHDLQHRDKTQKGKAALVKDRMRSRFARHLQLAAGSKHMAEVVLFTGQI